MSLADLSGPAQGVAANCLQFLRETVRNDGSWPIDTNLSVWVTTSALNALTAYGGSREGLAGDGCAGEALAQTYRWVATQQRQQVHAFTGAAPGGFGWTHLPGSVPDADDTSGAVLALEEGCTGAREEAMGGGSARTFAESVAAGRRWLLDLQNADGGWPTFCRGWGQLPFDKSCPDITAHALRALHGAADKVTAAARERARRYIAREQQPDGSWLPLWFGNQHAPGRANPVLGTARLLPAIRGEQALAAEVERGGAYLLGAQNADGGWGGAAGVASTVEETALAVTALAQVASGFGERGPLAASLGRGSAYLAGRIEDGSWTQPAPIGLYFAALWYSEALYPVIWTVEALGHLRNLLGRPPG